ncbi:hypothetical protein HGM15179_002743 [Zosterops borbonicus]|uniref:Uncharacterized protein n=1 Tax=Zosterops borbonicus TaxID=364589 RepID=A0A8K1GVU7_9PASS|nr:hypothetical protein HGM15179_002743 [Zosterops borbonicus]
MLPEHSPARTVQDTLLQEGDLSNDIDALNPSLTDFDLQALLEALWTLESHNRFTPGPFCCLEGLYYPSQKFLLHISSEPLLSQLEAISPRPDSSKSPPQSFWRPFGHLKATIGSLQNRFAVWKDSTTRAKNFSLISHLNLSSLTLKPFPLILTPQNPLWTFEDHKVHPKAILLLGWMGESLSGWIQL